MKRIILFAAAATAACVLHAQTLRFVTAELPPYTFQVPPATVAEEPGPGQGLVHEAVAEMATAGAVFAGHAPSTSSNFFFISTALKSPTTASRVFPGA